MLKIYTIILLFAGGLNLYSQNIREGMVTYITSQHVYVRFSSTGGLHDGDTLFIGSGGNEEPVLVILNHSSTTCVCQPLGSYTPKVSEKIFAVIHPARETNKSFSSGLENTDRVDSNNQTYSEIPRIPDSSAISNIKDVKASPFKQEIHGRLTLASYTDLSSADRPLSQRMRYTFALGAEHLYGTGLSLESYFTFRHSNTNFDEIRDNLFNGLKIYNLSFKFDFNESMVLLAGRRINPRLSSVGAIDGLQFEKSFGSFTAGLFSGFRPDYTDYSLNTDLFQYGAYVAHLIRGRNGRIQNTLGYIEQRNAAFVDRRFAYFQHTNNLVKNMFFYASAEVDLYQRVEEKQESVFDLYNVYLSLRYRIIRSLSAALSYNARNRLIYYETYKDFLDRLLEDEALQAWRLQVNYRPFKNLYLGANAGYRYRKDDLIPTRNIHSYLTYSNLPGIGGALTATVTWLQANYLDGMIYGVGMNREFIPGKVSGGIKYRYVDYLYRSSEMILAQHVGEANISWKIYRKLSLSAYYEGTFERKLSYNRVYVSLSQRF